MNWSLTMSLSASETMKIVDRILAEMDAEAAAQTATTGCSNVSAAQAVSRSTDDDWISVTKPPAFYHEWQDPTVSYIKQRFAAGLYKSKEVRSVSCDQKADHPAAI
tara:strand:- start:161 stop:478 length:318 start_codon:yes stop_codon:yes gene_type:complete